MSNEVDEFHKYLTDLEWSYEKAFERITGKSVKDDTGQVALRDIILVVETIQL